MYHRKRPSRSILISRLAPNNSTNYTNGHINYARRMTLHLPETIPDTTYIYGYVLLGATFIFFTTSVYFIVASKYMPDTHIKIVDWIKYDNYYCFLIPITVIVWIYWILWNWMGMKFFRHN